jgi:glycosyltransferase involved in cell wall biosynthesis
MNKQGLCMVGSPLNGLNNYNMLPTVTIICPVYNEEKYISVCMESMLAFNYPKELLEIIFVDGMSNDKTRNIIHTYIQTYPFIRLLDNNDKYVSFAMNKGIEEAKGDYIIRMDAHAFYPSDYVRVLIQKAFELEADNIGCMCKTDVFHKTDKALAIKEVLSHPLGVGNSLFRIGISEITESDTVPFGCFRKDVFDRFGLYDKRLIRNQDIELNKRIKSNGGKIYLIPDTYCVYYARETWKALFTNNFLNGKWNILTVFYTGNLSSLSIRHFIPLCFVLSLVLPLLLSFIHPSFAYLSLISAIAYLILMTYTSLNIAQKKQLHFLSLWISFIVIHLSYGLGSLSGLFIIPFKKKHTSYNA